MEILKHVGNTIFGMYQQKFCHEWDLVLRKIINECEVSEFSEHTITFTTKCGQVCVWCANKWYGFGHLYEVNGKSVGGKTSADHDSRQCKNFIDSIQDYAVKSHKAITAC